MILLIPLTVLSQIQEVGKGTIDWGDGVVVAKGIGAPNPSMPAAVSRPSAIRVAKMIALRNAMEIIKGIPLNSETTIENGMLANDKVFTSVEGFIKKFEFVKDENGKIEHYMSDGTVEIYVKVPIHGIGGIGEATFGLESDAIQEKPSIKKMPKVNAITATVFSGLIIDATGLGVKPAISPKVIDEDGKEIYGSAYVSRDFAVKFGVAGYAKTVEGAQKQGDRIGLKPGIVKALRASGSNKTDIVLSTNDANSVRSSAKNLKFLSECRVIIIID